MSARDDLIDEYGHAEAGTAPWTLNEFRQRLAEVRAERDAEIIAWLGKKALQYRSTRSRQHALQADAIDGLASKISRGAVRANNTATLPDDEPLIVDRFDTATEPAIEEEPVLVVGCIAEDGRPVALLLDREDRAKVGRWLNPEPTRAAVLAEAADLISASQPFPEPVQRGAEWAARTLRRMADEATATGPGTAPDATGDDAA
ncbi:hypothetical protein ACWF94_03565 [Streptomyces sp. NPDC055078]